MVQFRFFPFFSLSAGRKKRSADSVLAAVENYLPFLINLPGNSTGQNCLRRAICEGSMEPRHNEGLFGEVLNLFLASDSYENEKYLEPKREAKNGCSRFRNECSLSFFETQF